MRYFELKESGAEIEDQPVFVGGTPPLPSGSQWPNCRICGDMLVHFLDVPLPNESAPFKASSRLQMFACREHDDIAGTIYSDYRRFDNAGSSGQLPERYWEITDGHYLIRLLPPDAITAPGETEKRLALKRLSLVSKVDSEADPAMSLKLFGYPNWAQDPEEHVCCCGNPMQMILQIPDGFGFDMAVGAPEQPNSFSHRQYCLFLGNELYLLACTAQCHPMALWPVLQN